MEILHRSLDKATTGICFLNKWDVFQTFSFSLWICMFLFNKPPNTGNTSIWFYFLLFPTIRAVETLMMHSPVSPQWPWSWWIRVWACGNPRPESHPAHPAPRTAPPMVLCQMAATRKGKYSLNVFVRFTQSWCLRNIPFFFWPGPH